MTQRKRLRGSIRLSRIDSNVREAYVSIRVRDYESATEFLEAELSITAAMEMLLGSIAECEFEVRGLDRLGKRRETMQLPIVRPPKMTDQEFIAHAKAVFETANLASQGWTFEDALLSGHKIRGGFSFSLRRWVDAADAEQTR